MFVKGVVRGFHAAALISGAPISLSGLSQTGPAGCQLRVLPDQRSGFCARTFAYRLARLASVAWSRPSWRAFGVTKRIALCRCWQLYQLAKDFTQAFASALVANPLVGRCGRYFQVLNSASENGLSLLTRGRL